MEHIKKCSDHAFKIWPIFLFYFNILVYFFLAEKKCRDGHFGMHIPELLRGTGC